LAPEVDGAKIGLRPVASLLPHEETIPAKSEKLYLDMKKEKIQRDPMIVDYESGTVLDGMHRLSAFKKMKAEYAVCHLVDYSSPSVTLERWLRVYKVGRKELVPSILENLGLSQKVPLTDIFDLVEKREVALGVIAPDGCHVARADGPAVASGFALVRRLDSVFSTMGWGMSFTGEDEIDVATQDSKNMVVLTPKVNKQDVLNAARSGQLLPWKTTMHVVDPRPVAIDFPLADLMKPSPPSSELEALLREGGRKLTPPDTIYKGRRYKERLLVLRG